MAANFLVCEEEEEEISSSLVPTRSEGGGANEFSSSVLKALQSTAFKSGVNVISAAVSHGPLTGRLIGQLCSKLNVEKKDKSGISIHKRRRRRRRRLRSHNCFKLLISLLEGQ